MRFGVSLCLIAGFAGMVGAAGPAAGQNVPAGLTAECREAFQRYLAAPAPKVFAAGRTQSCGWWYPGRQKVEMAEIRERALAQCRQNGGEGCRVIASVR